MNNTVSNFKSQACPHWKEPLLYWLSVLHTASRWGSTPAWPILPTRPGVMANHGVWHVTGVGQGLTIGTNDEDAINKRQRRVAHWKHTHNTLLVNIFTNMCRFFAYVYFKSHISKTHHLRNTTKRTLILSCNSTNQSYTSIVNNFYK